MTETESTNKNLDQVQTKLDTLIAVLREIEDRPWTDRWISEVQDIARLALLRIGEPVDG